MKCQKCGVNYASINYTRIVNGKRMELHLCDECAQKMNLQVNVGFEWEDMFSRFFEDFSDMRSMAMPRLMGLKDFHHGFDQLMSQNIFDEIPFFQNDFFFGEKRLTEAQNDELDNVLSGIQKKYQTEKKSDEKKEAVKDETKNNTKVTDKKQEEIRKLKEKMQEYVQKEEYEKAAVLRDQIKKLES